MDISSAVRQWAEAHPALYNLLYLPLVGTVINALIWLFTHTRWDELLQSTPRLAAFLKLFKAAGLDPVGVLKCIYTMLTGRQLPRSAKAPARRQKPPAPPPSSIGAVMFFALCLAATSGCAWLKNSKVTELVAQVQTYQDSARTIVAEAKVALEDAIEALPEADRTKAQAQFARAFLIYTKADQALTRARELALQTQDEDANPAQAIRALVEAVRGVVDVVRLFSAGKPVVDGRANPALLQAEADLRRLEARR